jgi:hypothetical protein
MTSTSDSELLDRWEEFIELVGRRRGMYTLTGSLAEVGALLTGFDNGVGPSFLTEFQGWMSERHPEQPQLVFEAHVLHEVASDHTTNLRIKNLSETENDLAVTELLALLKQYLAERRS